jgi:hypothetical protein
MALRFGVRVAGVLCAMRRYGLIFDDRIAQDGSFANRRGAGDDSQEFSPIDLR